MMQHIVQPMGESDQTGKALPHVVEGITNRDHAPHLLTCGMRSRQGYAHLKQQIVHLACNDGASADIAAMRAALGLQTIIRYLGQRHWEEESSTARTAEQVEPGLKLENVAAHSWQVADAALLLAPQFPELSVGRVVELAILHDKLELITGDFDPVGSDGRGTDSHAFDAGAQHRKRAAELLALENYLARIREPARSMQRDLLLDVIDGISAEARFVKAIDKLQALIFVIEKKKGVMTDEHIDFSVRYAGKAMEYFPGLATHCQVLFEDLLRSVAIRRATQMGDVEARLSPLSIDLIRRGLP